MLVMHPWGIEQNGIVPAQNFRDSSLDHTRDGTLGTAYSEYFPNGPATAAHLPADISLALHAGRIATSRRIRTSLPARKERGTKLGNPRNAVDAAAAGGRVSGPRR